MSLAPSVRDRMLRVRLVLLDVDGVLTDGRLGYGPNGDTFRQFHVRDGTAVKIARAAGLRVGLLSGRSTAATSRWAQDAGVDEAVQGRRVKEPAFREILERQRVELAEVAYMGDDVLDLPVLALAGLAAAPCDACPEVLAAAHWVSARPGGAGCARELLETVLRVQGRWDGLVATRFWPDDAPPDPLR